MSVRTPSRSSFTALVTGAAWLLALVSFGRQIRSVSGLSSLGFDAKIYAAAARAVAHGLSPYSVSGLNSVYPPSCALFMWPLAWVSASDVPQASLALTSAAVVLLAAVAGRTAGDSWSTLRAPLILLALSLAPPTRAVLALGNFSAVIALGFSIVLLLAVRNRWTAAGVVLGVTLAIKPMLAPVLIVFLLEKRWKGLGAAVAIPTTLIVVSSFIVREPWRFVSEALPFLTNRHANAMDVENSAIPAVFRILGSPPVLSILTQLVVVVLVAIGIMLIQRNEADSRVRIVTTASLLMAGTFLAGSLSEAHYVLVLVPLFIGFSHGRSYLRWWAAAVCYLLVTATLSDRLAGFRSLSFQTKERAAGLALLIVVIVVEAAMRHRARGGPITRYEPHAILASDRSDAESRGAQPTHGHQGDR